MEEKKKRFGFFRQIGTAVAKPGQYERFLHLTAGRTLAFVFVFVLLTTFVSYYLPFIISQVFGESYNDIIDEYVPEFTLENDILTLSEPLEYDDGRTLVIANSGIEAFTQEDLNEYAVDHIEVYLIGKTNMIFYSGGQSTVYAYSDLSIDTLDREGLRGYVPGMYMMIVVSGLMNYILSTCKYFLGALLLMLIGKSMAGLWRSSFNYLELFQLGVFSKVTYEIIASILLMFNFAVPMSFFVGLAVGFFYISTAVRRLNANGYVSGSARQGGGSGTGAFGGLKKPAETGIYGKAKMRVSADSASAADSGNGRSSVSAADSVPITDSGNDRSSAPAADSSSSAPVADSGNGPDAEAGPNSVDDSAGGDSDGGDAR